MKLSLLLILNLSTIVCKAKFTDTIPEFGGLVSRIPCKWITLFTQFDGYPSELKLGKYNHHEWLRDVVYLTPIESFNNSKEISTKLSNQWSPGLHGSCNCVVKIDDTIFDDELIKKQLIINDEWAFGHYGAHTIWYGGTGTNESLSKALMTCVYKLRAHPGGEDFSKCEVLIQDIVPLKYIVGYHHFADDQMENISGITWKPCNEPLLVFLELIGLTKYFDKLNKIGFDELNKIMRRVNSCAVFNTEFGMQLEVLHFFRIKRHLSVYDLGDWTEVDLDLKLNRARSG